MQRKKYLIKGVVQGVGFRPFIYKTATNLNLKGFVKNSSLGVEIEVEGERFEEFEKALSFPPALSKIDSIASENISTKNSTKFEILESSFNQNQNTFIPPDTKICKKCLNDMKNTPRYKDYFFTSCTECGMRYSIIKALPFDRKNISMSEFQMCEECEEEYNNPKSRRFHYQGICCEKCGPKLNKSIKEFANDIKEGKICAIKGVGGFHIVVDSKNDEAIKNLRKLKNRKSKPFALLCKDINEIKTFAKVTQKEEEVLLSKESPIVLLEKSGFTLSNFIAPNINKIGCFLPYSGLQILLLEKLENPIIATSANQSGSPIITNSEELKEKLPFIESILDFDLEIINRSDDSVVQVIHDKIQILRGARGYYPKVIKLPKKIDKKILAVGANSKSTISIAFEDSVIISPYLGNLENLENLEHFKYSVKSYEKLFNISFDLILCDRHPNYESSKWAKTQNKEVIEITHHLAHIYAIKAEHKNIKEYVGFSFDGSGYGDDGSLWGGEVFVNDERKYHFKPIKLLGEKAIRSPRRVALSMLFENGIENTLSFSQNEVKILKQSFVKNINVIETSSVGRLFDGVVGLSRIIDEVSYEGESGLLCEANYDENIEESFHYEIKDGVIDIKFFENFDEKRACSMFINTLANIIKEISYENVIISGGVFQNSTLLKLLDKNYYFGHVNDEGISLGQVYYYINKMV